jgi:TPR repeat protein
MADGYIYALINPSLQGLVKVGKTTKDPEIRAKEISSDTGVPTPFIVAFKVFVSDCNQAEAFLHSLLQVKGHRINQNREFFNAPLDEIINAMLELRNSSNLMEYKDPKNKSIESDFEFSTNIDDDFLNDLNIEEKPVFEDVLIEAENAYYGLEDSLQDYTEALQLYKHAIKLGGVEAYTRVGEMYTLGEGCKIDYQIALNYLKEGASKGNSNCYFYMGLLFSETENKMNMDKCFKKYFLSDAFIEDCNYSIIYENKIGNIIRYCLIIDSQIATIETEVLNLFYRLRSEIEHEFNRKINYNKEKSMRYDFYENARTKLFAALDKL